jgi:hypothetical protein
VVLKDRYFTAPIGEALFAMVANRVLAPSSKLAIEQWTSEDVFLGSEEALQVRHFYHAMDFFLNMHKISRKNYSGLQPVC